MNTSLSNATFKSGFHMERGLNKQGPYWVFEICIMMGAGDTYHVDGHINHQVYNSRSLQCIYLGL